MSFEWEDGVSLLIYKKRTFLWPLGFSYTKHPKSPTICQPRPWFFKTLSCEHLLEKRISAYKIHVSRQQNKTYIHKVKHVSSHYPRELTETVAWLVESWFSEAKQYYSKSSEILSYMNTWYAGAFTVRAWMFKLAIKKKKNTRANTIMNREVSIHSSLTSYELGSFNYSAVDKKEHV